MLDGTVTTADELLHRHEPGVTLELVRGELARMSNAGWWHGAIASRIGARLQLHVNGHGLGLVFAAETGFWVERQPDTVRSPDASFVRTERLPAAWSRGWFEGPPDLAVEVTSPDDTYAAVHEKALSWLRYGAQVVWVVEPAAQRVSVYRPGGSVQVLAAADTLTGGDVLPGFVVPVAELFPAPR